jgi:hypothetical protein
MAVLVEPFASVYDDGSRLGVILARGRGGFEAYARMPRLGLQRNCVGWRGPIQNISDLPQGLAGRYAVG